MTKQTEECQMSQSKYRPSCKICSGTCEQNTSLGPLCNTDFATDTFSHCWKVSIAERTFNNLSNTEISLEEEKEEDPAVPISHFTTQKTVSLRTIRIFILKYTDSSTIDLCCFDYLEYRHFMLSSTTFISYSITVYVAPYMTNELLYRVNFKMDSLYIKRSLAYSFNQSNSM
ncbi:hypothetical protein BDA99DRAFT_536071 [Phascolomyces articulosus]|uniref:Uncharacterized protein n=1 Tax=Phascolomyces articulosus TaxID=60185 RepID=A0AAD5KCZ6_9FUNG|nr:hypothetical protein BDA99DRAFT_536071 [Phascolomyces articulosus]